MGNERGEGEIIMAMIGKPDECTGCALYTIGKGFAPLDWNPEKFRGVMIVGEAAGDAEAREGKPFRPHAQSGSLLADAMREVGMSRGEVAVANIVSCHPPKDFLIGAPWEDAAISHCTSAHLARFIKQVQPKIILAVGAVAFEHLTERPHGRSGTLDYSRGFTFPGKGPAAGIPVIAAFHPAFIRRGAAHLTPLLIRDLRRANLIANGKLVEGVHWTTDPHTYAAKARYITTPSISEAWEWYRVLDPTRAIYADIETPRSRREDEDDRNSFADRDINMIQFTQRRGEGIALPWRDEFVDVAKAILATPMRKVGHNWFGFDLPVLAANDVVVNGPQDDTMLQFHHYHADLPANLQAVAQFCGFPCAWKHISDSDPEVYGCFDVDATCWADETLTTILQRDGLYTSYQRYFVDFWPIMRDMAARGVPIDDTRRLELKTVIGVEDIRATEEIKAIVPAEVMVTKQKWGYKNPPILTCVECGWKGRVDHICAGKDEETGEVVEESVPYAALAESNGLVLRPITIPDGEKCRCTKTTRPSCDVCAGTGVIPAGVSEMRWASLTEFNPNSSPQVKRYMKFRKHPIPKHAKRVDAAGEASDTTEVKELERLFAKTRDPIYPLLIQKRQLSKIEGTYVEGWRPGRDGRIHTTFTFKPATWQTSSRQPNIQNGLKHGKTAFQKRLAKAFNGMQRAEPGHTMINFDFKSFHAQTTACEFGLPDYLRLAKIDIHSFVTCHYLRLPERHGLYELPDEEMKAVFARLKKNETFKFTRDYKAKRCIAEGELVLTLRGLVPIQNVTLADLVWDGVEWVHHEGLIDQGIREVITYDGLTATPDHKVFTQDGRCIPLGQAASEMDRLLVSGIGGQAIRTRHRDKLEAVARERTNAAENEVLNLRKGWNGGLSLADLRQGERVPALRTNEIPTSGTVGPQVRCDHLQVLLPVQSEVESVRGTGDHMQVHDSQRVRSVCGERTPARELQGCGDRPYQQRRTLRAGEPTPRYPQATDGESVHHSVGTDSERAGTTDRVGLALSVHMDREVGTEGGHDRGTDYRVCEDAGAPKVLQNVASVGSVARFARTYDLANAGPRKCFTVAGKLVANCILGIQFAMGPNKLYQLNPDDFDSMAEAQTLHRLIMVDLFPGLKVGQDAQRALAVEQGYLMSKYGAIRRFYDVQRYDRNKGKMVPGDQAEAAVAFCPASNAFGHVRETFLIMRERGWDERYQFVNSIHDSIQAHCPDGLVEECIANVTEVMSAPSTVLVYPKVAPGGLSVEAEASVGRSLAEMEEWKG